MELRPRPAPWLPLGWGRGNPVPSLLPCLSHLDKRGSGGDVSRRLVLSAKSDKWPPVSRPAFPCLSFPSLCLPFPFSRVRCSMQAGLSIRGPPPASPAVLERRGSRRREAAHPSCGAADPPASVSQRASSVAVVDACALAGQRPFTPLSCAPLGFGDGHDWDPSQLAHPIAHAQWSACTGVSGSISASGIEDQPAIPSEVIARGGSQRAPRRA